MRKRIIAFTALLLILSSVLSACANTNQSAVQTAAQETFDPYAAANIYDEIDRHIFKSYPWYDYGTVLEDVAYYSRAAGENKTCNILLPATFDETKQYPVMYVIHGFSGTPADHVQEGAYLTVLYGNMLRKRMTREMIIVSVDMYTGKRADKESKTDAQLRFIYDKVVDDIVDDLMPFIEKTYPVKTGRENTAIAGISEGGAKALATGFKRLDAFGFIGSFAPDPGVIPTPYYKGTYFNPAILEQFEQPNESNTPYYLYLAVGTNDEWNVDVTRYYHEVLDKAGIKNQFDLPEGYEHDNLFWGCCFYNFFYKVFR